MNLTKLTTFFFLSFLSNSHLCANMPEFDDTNALEVLCGRTIVIALKVGGGLTFSEYYHLINEANGDQTFSPEEVREKWINNKLNVNTEKFLITRSLDSKLSTGSVINIDSCEGCSSSIGSQYVLFLKENKTGNHQLGFCSYVKNSYFPRKFLANSSANEIIKYVINNNLTTCLSEQPTKQH